MGELRPQKGEIASIFEVSPAEAIRRGKRTPAQARREAEEKNKAKLRASYHDQSSVDKVYAWVKETFKSEPMTASEKLARQNLSKWIEWKYGIKKK